MARRKLTREQEDQLIAASESLRDQTEAELARVEGSTSPSAMMVLSVRLPFSDLQKIRALAEDSEKSVSQLMQAAVEALISKPSPSYSDSIDKFFMASPLERSTSGSSEGHWEFPRLEAATTAAA